MVVCSQITRTEYTNQQNKHTKVQNVPPVYSGNLTLKKSEMATFYSLTTVLKKYFKLHLLLLFLN